MPAEHVVILIPGLMGSELTLDGELVWPGSARSLVFPYKNMAKLLDPNLKATDVIRSFSISEQYNALIRDMRVCGFAENERLYVCPYDWRKSISLAAPILADKVSDIVKKHGNGVEVSLIGHSMGGLVSRYYLESDLFNAREGFNAIRRLITLGTPHRGSPLALSAALGHEKRLFLNKDQVRTLINDPRYPGVYQLLPPPGEPYAWDAVASACYSPMDIYDRNISIKLNGDNLNAAREFWGHLDLAKRPKVIRYFFFVGSRQVTISAVHISGNDITKVETEDAGDGTVPIWSAMANGVQNQPVGGEHGTIYKNDDLRRTLGVLLGYTGRLSAVGNVEISVRDRVIEPRELLHVALTFAAGVNRVNGYIRLEKVDLNPDGSVKAYVPTNQTYPIRYSGVTADKLGVAFNAPEWLGIYKVRYYDDAGEMLGEDDLFVQESEPN